MTPAATAMLASKVRVAREGIAHCIADMNHELRVGSENETQAYLIPRPRAWIGGWKLDEPIAVQYYFCYFCHSAHTQLSR